MQILVTGAAGFVGSHLAERLAELGHAVVGVDDFDPYYDPGLKELNAQDLDARGVAVRRVDLAADPLDAVVADAEVVYHLAAQPGIAKHVPFAAYLRNNVVGTHRLLEAVRGAGGLRVFVNVSTSSVYGADATGPETTEPKPTSYYGVTKLAGEQLALSYQRTHGLPACSLRLFSVYGPRERPEKLFPRLLKSILQGTEFPLFAGSDRHVRSYTYVGDAVNGMVAVLDRIEACVGEVFNVGSGIEMTTAEGIAIVEELLGRRARLVEQPPRPGDQNRTCADIGKARRVLGYEPETMPREGLALEAAWYRDRIHGRVVA